jgi:alpha-1,2-mannosyltransferase
MVTTVNPVASQAPSAARAPGTRLVRAGVIAFAAVVASWLVFEAVNGALSLVDLTVYRDGGLIVRHVRPYYDPHAYAPLYNWGGFSPLALKFTYTPFAAVAFAAVSFLPWGVIVDGSVVVNMAALVAALWFTFGGLGYTERRVRLGATLLAAAAVFWLQPVVRTIYLGQINLVLMAAIMWDLCQPDRTASGRRRWWKGALTGVAAGIKLVPLIFVPYLLVTRRFREAAATVAGFLVTVAVGFAVLPHDSAKWWLHGMFLADGNRTGFMGWAGNQSLRAIVTRFAGSIAAGQGPWIAAAVVALAAGLTAAYLLNRAGYPVPALLATALTGLLVSPVSWDHHWVWIAPGLALIIDAAVRAGRAGATGLRAAWYALAAAVLIVFASWPDFWSKTAGLLQGGLINYAQSEGFPNGDNPTYREYHWHGLELIAGNLELLAGLGLFLVVLAVAFHFYRATRLTPRSS